MIKESLGRKLFTACLALVLAALAIQPGPAVAEPLDAAYRAQRIPTLLSQARRALAQDRLTLPSGDNAVRYAQQILDLAPGHPDALRVLEEVVQRYGLIADTALDRAEALRAREVARARTYQRRGQDVVQRFNIPDAPLRGLSARIGALDETALNAGVEGAKRHPAAQRLLDELIAGYAGKSESALQRGDPAEARRYCDIAKDIAARYQVPLTGLAALDQRVLVAEVERDRVASRSATEGEVRVRIVYPAAFIPPAF
ncbi:MAG: hypothetical protein ACREWG_02715 [Gammaproteobacteria bacterium]